MLLYIAWNKKFNPLNVAVYCMKWDVHLLIVAGYCMKWDVHLLIVAGYCMKWDVHLLNVAVYCMKWDVHLLIVAGYYIICSGLWRFINGIKVGMFTVPFFYYFLPQREASHCVETRLNCLPLYWNGNKYKQLLPFNVHLIDLIFFLQHFTT